MNCHGGPGSRSGIGGHVNHGLTDVKKNLVGTEHCELLQSEGKCMISAGAQLCTSTVEWNVGSGMMMYEGWTTSSLCQIRMFTQICMRLLLLCLDIDILQSIFVTTASESPIKPSGRVHRFVQGC